VLALEVEVQLEVEVSPPPQKKTSIGVNGGQEEGLLCWSDDTQFFLFLKNIRHRNYIISFVSIDAPKH
jgi:hypothetical protein